MLCFVEILQFKVSPLAEKLFCEVNPIPVKAALSAIGQCKDVLRLPLVPMGDANRALLLQAMRDYGFSC